MSEISLLAEGSPWGNLSSNASFPATPDPKVVIRFAVTQREAPMLDSAVSSLPSFKTKNLHSVSGLSSGAFMTVQLHIAHSASFIGAGVIAGGPYRAAETFRGAAPSVPLSCILNSLYIAMTPLTAATAPDVDKLVALARETADIDDLKHIAKQRMYIFTGSEDKVVNQHGVNATRAFYEKLGVTPENLLYVDDVPAGHSIITMNPEDSALGTNKPPYINNSAGWTRPFVQSHDILRHIYGDLKDPVARIPGQLMRFDQSEFYTDAPSEASMAPFGYVYIPSKVAEGGEALGVHIAIHGCKQGYDYVNYVNGIPDMRNQPPYGSRYITTTGYMEIAEANDLIVVFPQVGGDDDAAIQNPDGCWDWWGYTAKDPQAPDYYSQNAVQIHAIHSMLTRLTSA